MEIWCTKGLRGFEAADEASLEVIRKIPLKTIVRVEFTRPRNLAMHRKFFALLTTVWSACGEWDSVEDLLIELKVRLGICREIAMRSTGELIKLPGSISFAKMDQDGFNKFYEDALQELCEMAGGIEHDALRQSVLKSLAA